MLLTGTCLGDAIVPLRITATKPGYCTPQGCFTQPTTVTNYGTAVIVGMSKSGQMAALTAAHNYEGLSNYRTQLYINGQWVYGRHAAQVVGQTAEVSLVTFPPQDVQPLKPNWSKQETGQSVSYGGYPEGGHSLVMKSGKVSSTTVMMEISGPVPRVGESGGPVINDKGEVIGIIYGYGRDGTVLASRLHMCGQMLSDWLATRPMLAAKPDANPAQGVDPNEKWVAVSKDVEALRNQVMATDSRLERLEGQLEALISVSSGLQAAIEKQREEVLANSGAVAVMASKHEQDFAAVDSRLEALRKRVSEYKRKVVVARRDGSVVDEEEYGWDDPIVIQDVDLKALAEAVKKLGE